jgi:hypothetical protein
MTLHEFRTKAYEILTHNGFEEINSKIYYPESSVLSMLEWMVQNADQLPGNSTDTVKKIIETINVAFSKINGGG